MAITEKKFLESLRAHIPRAHWQRIESWQVAPGVPDLNGCQDGQEVWIEAKIVKGKKVNVTPLQVNWLETRARHGGKVYIVALYRDRLIAVWGGEFARKVADEGIDAPGGLLFEMDLHGWSQLESAIFA